VFKIFVLPSGHPAEAFFFYYKTAVPKISDLAVFNKVSFRQKLDLCLSLV